MATCAPIHFFHDFVRNPIHGMALVCHAVRERRKKSELTKAVLALPDDVRTQYAAEISFLCRSSRLEAFPYPRRNEGIAPT